MSNKNNRNNQRQQTAQQVNNPQETNMPQVNNPQETNMPQDSNPQDPTLLQNTNLQDTNNPTNSPEGTTEETSETIQAPQSPQDNSLVGNSPVDNSQAETVVTQTTTTEDLNPVKVTEVSKPMGRQLNQGRVLAPVISEFASLEEIQSEISMSDNLHMQMLNESLKKLENRLGITTNSPMEDVAKAMVGLHNTLLGVINNAKTNQDFNEQWAFVLKFFEEHKNNGLGQHRVYRGVAYWPKSQDEYMHYQALLNLIYVTNNIPKDKWSKNINFTAVTKHPVTDAGRGRLMGYYL
jgi:hypothetical protein